jgi:hypothetical protein
MMVMVIKRKEMDTELSDQGKGIIVGFALAGLKMSREVIDRV